MKNLCKQWTLASFVLVGGCQLGVEQLEVGDEDSNETGEAEGDGDGIAADECWAQGSNIEGDPDPLDFPLPECEVVCASGWGHGAASLAIDWTLDLQHEGPTTGWTHLDKLPNGTLVAVIGREAAPARLVFVSPAGELLAEVEQPAIADVAWDMGVDASGTIYAIWPNGVAQSLTALSSAGEHLWTIELAAYESYSSVLAPLDAGVVVAVNPVFQDQTSELVRVSPNGTVTWTSSIPFTYEIAVSPDNSSIALANPTSITWTDFELFPNTQTTMGIADVDIVLGLAALDEQRVAVVGTSKNYAEGGSPRGVIKTVGAMGLEWEQFYDRASSWCPDESPTLETFIDVVQLADGSTLIVGAEIHGEGGLVQQPWVGHVSATGEMLGMDRGFWRGQAAAAVAGDDGSAYALISEFDEQGQQHLHVRKYSP